MAIRVIVFDFDGTLVDSNPIKRQAYFSLFPAEDRYQTAIRQALDSNFEASRYVIFEQILRTLNLPEQAIQAEVQRYAERYNDTVVAGVKTCPECLGAEQVLRQLSQQYSLYLSSTTPEEALREIIHFRQWTGYFRGVFGYPRKKSETLRAILHEEQVSPAELIVVGDGETDRMAAAQVGCGFWDIRVNTLFTFLEEITSGIFFENSVGSDI